MYNPDTTLPFSMPSLARASNAWKCPSGSPLSSNSYNHPKCTRLDNRTTNDLLQTPTQKNANYPTSRRVHADCAEQPPCIVQIQDRFSGTLHRTLQKHHQAHQSMDHIKRLNSPSVSAISSASLDSFRDPPVTCRRTKQERKKLLKNQGN